LVNGREWICWCGGQRGVVSREPLRPIWLERCVRLADFFKESGFLGVGERRIEDYRLGVVDEPVAELARKNLDGLGAMVGGRDRCRPREVKMFGNSEAGAAKSFRDGLESARAEGEN